MLRGHRRDVALVLIALFLVGLAGGARAVGAEPASAPLAQPVPDRHQPIYLRAASGDVIDPIAGENDDEPYSPRQTCGAEGCHDYEAITAGYHFQQGRESLSDDYSEESPWVLSDGMFGKF